MEGYVTLRYNKKIIPKQIIIIKLLNNKSKHIKPYLYYAANKGVCCQCTKIATFSGDVKSETAYDLWKYEADCPLNEWYPIHQAIKKSLKEKQAMS